MGTETGIVDHILFILRLQGHCQLRVGFTSNVIYSNGAIIDPRSRWQAHIVMVL